VSVTKIKVYDVRLLKHTFFCKMETAAIVDRMSSCHPVCIYNSDNYCLVDRIRRWRWRRWWWWPG